MTRYRQRHNSAVAVAAAVLFSVLYFDSLLQILPGLETLKKDLGNDTSLTDGDPRKLEMRAVLEDPIGQKYIGQFAKKVMTQVRGLSVCKELSIQRKGSENEKAATQA